MGNRFKCTNPKMPFDGNIFCEDGKDDFGCIYHEEINNWEQY